MNVSKPEMVKSARLGALVLLGLSAAGAQAHPRLDAAGPTAVLPAGDGAGADIPVRISVGAALDLEGSPVVLRSLPQVRAPMPLQLAGLMPTGSPLALRRLTSGFGLRVDPFLGGLRMHSGLDFAAPRGTPVGATAAGVVERAGWMGGYGNSVIVDHGGGLQTRYGHLSGIMVVPGETVPKGAVLGLVGSTGRSTGNHLHYEVRYRGSPIDPARSGRPASRSTAKVVK